MIPEGKKPLDFNLLFHLSPNDMDEQKTTSVVDIDVNLNKVFNP